LSYERESLADVEEIYRDLETGPNGLLSHEANLRLQETGPNVLPKGKKVGIASRFLHQMGNLFNVLLLVASCLSFVSGFSYGDAASVQMGLALVAVVFVNAFFSLLQEYRAERVIQAVSGLIPSKTKVVREGHDEEIDVADVVPGDLLALEEGDRVPADLRLTSAFEVSVDNSALTGESEPLRRFATMTPGMPTGNPYELQNILFAGTTLVSGVARGVVLRTGRETQFGKIVSLSGEVKEPLSPLQKDIDYTAKVDLLLAILVSAVFFSAALLLVGLSVVDSILFAIGVMICLVPEGFQLTVSLSLALTADAMSKRNVVVKRLSSVDTMGSMTVMCVDKTGTITSGEMMVRKLWAGGRIFEVTGDGYSPAGSITLSDRRVDRSTDPHILKFLEVAVFCNNAKLNAPSDRIGRWSVLGDPTDGAFLVLAGKGDFNVAKATAENRRIRLFPFDSHRRMMTSVHKSKSGRVVAYTKGAGPEILARCKTVFSNDRYVLLDEEERRVLSRQIDVFASEGYRVLGMASKSLPHEPTDSSLEIESDMAFLGLAALFDPPRPKVENAVRQAKSAGVKVIMLTGDHELTAYSIARQVGIITSENQTVVTGSELVDMNDRELGDILENGSTVFARTTPEQKLRIVQVLKSRGETVAVTGDGVNDSPVLIEANVGIAMGAGGTDVARESADMVLLDNDFTSIVEGVKLGRATFDNLRKFVYYVFTHNWAELFAFVVFVLFRTPLPLLVVQVLAIDLGMDVLPSLSLIMEPPEPGVMAKPPRKSDTRLIDALTLFRSFCVGLVVSVGAVFWAFNVWSGGGWTFGQVSVPDPASYARGTTVVMVGIMMGQLGNLFAARTSSESAFRSSPLRNKWVFAGILAELCIVLAIVYVPLLQLLFKTAPLLPVDWLFLSALAPATLLLEELRKLLTRELARSARQR